MPPSSALPNTPLDLRQPPSPLTGRWNFDNTYARLPDRFYARLQPTPVSAPRLVKVNRALAETMGIKPDALDSAEGAAILAGNRVPEGAEPMALAYAGHQFGNFVPQLGDGRAILLGEVVGPDGARHDVQLKGSGRTPFSRMGDGRAALGPVLREYLVSEAMAALGVPTTRALAVVMTGEPVIRETVLPGAVLTRVAASHLRIGTFQYFAARGDTDALRTLSDYAIARHDPNAAQARQPYRALLDGVIARQAELVARWMMIGFVHGVMNTDNMSISGETIDYGPCAFIDSYDPATVFSAIDQHGRYAYGNQPRIIWWNLARFAETLLPLLDENEDLALASARAALAGFGPRFETARSRGMRRKLGLSTEREEDAALGDDLLDCMAANGADFTLTFRGLCDAATGSQGLAAVRSLFTDASAFDSWSRRWRQRLDQEPGSPEQSRATMRTVNPAVIPRNHLVQSALEAAVAHQDFRPFEELLAVLSGPYEDMPDMARYAMPPRPHERVRQTFCGT